MGKVSKMQKGGALGMKSVKAGFDKNPGVTRADIIVAAKKQAKGGKSVKKARGGASLSPTASNVSRKLSSPFKKKAKGGATLSPSSKSTSNRLASNLKMKKGGSVKKAMGGYKMKMGGRCRGGC